MFDPGEAVTYRELWLDRVMTAMPMRVVADDHDTTVLYLASGSRFQAARAPGGGPVRDLANWVSVSATWSGGSLIRLLPSGCWYCIDLEFDANREFRGYYVNFQEPMRRTVFGYDTVDLVLDVVVDPDGTARLKDEEDFDDAVAAGHIANDVAVRIREEARRVLRMVERDGAPANAEPWLRWRPSESWDSPTLAGGWQEVRA